MPDVTSLLEQAIPHYLGGDRADLPPGGSTGSTARSPADPRGSADTEWIPDHLELAKVRTPGQSLIDVRGSDSGGLDIFAVNDDMPLLVEAILTSLDAHDLSVSSIEHPVMACRRDTDGNLTGFGRDDSAVTESWIHVAAVAHRPDSDVEMVRSDLQQAVARVADVAHDTDRMRDLLTSGGVGDEADDEWRRLLEWFAGSHFQLLGYVRVDSSGSPSDHLGIWRSDEVPATLVADAEPAPHPEVSRVHLDTGIARTAFPTLIRFPASADHRTGEHRFLGVYTSSGLHQTVLDVPVLRSEVRAVIDRAGVDDDSFAGRSMIDLLQDYPIAEMFETTTGQLARRVTEMLGAVATRTLRVFVRVNPAGGNATALIYLPRDRYTTSTRLAMQDVVRTYLHGTDVEYAARVSERSLAALQVTVHVDGLEAVPGSFDIGTDRQQALQSDLADAIRSWDERARALCRETVDGNTHPNSADSVEAGDLAADHLDLAAFPGGVDALMRFVAALPDAYKDRRDPRAAVRDLARVSTLAPGEISVALQRSIGGTNDAHIWDFTLFLCGESATLTDVLPVLHSLGVDVVDEHPYVLARPDGQECRVYEFRVRPAEGMTVATDDADDLEHRFTDAFAQIWLGAAEADPYNELVLRCGLGWRSAAMLRVYGRYLRQCGFSYSTGHVAATLGEYPDVTTGLVAAFESSFDPDRSDDSRRDEILEELRTAVGGVMGLDADRICSAFASVVTATSRTNYYVDGGSRPVIAVKLRPREIPQAPKPRPLHEIYVYSPRIEGVHLRFGAVARGGLRWSDRREDFRTEILGLAKAQTVKNAVIVPLGAKGGFVVRRPPTPTGDPAADREAAQDEGVACYRAFIAGLLDVTDNIDLATGDVVSAPSVVRRDGDDPYLVVAADKGTASFSDIANEVAADYGFWLGDAFASGGSVGYDHKAMGITARGAWESVKRHFREMGVDTQAQEFTVVGVGDMSGDVFGNGMLCSEHIRLVAAFDHRHVFIDPDPDSASSFTERQRLFDLSRSSWDDYDRSQISAGGGVWSREVKSIPIGDEIRAALALDADVTELTPPELIRAVLLAPVDLLWNGGIGTYLKASTESDADVGDKANDPIRVDGNKVRVKVIGEGGNLGVTSAGRVEFDLNGGHINTDAMDNSAGVDCSDHEVNIKIVLDSAVSTGDLPASERTPLLESMTDEVAQLVLADNISQNTELGFIRSRAERRVEVQARLLGHLATAHDVDLHLEGLPGPAELRKRLVGDLHRGLTSPELATLLAHVKMAAKADLLDGDLPDNDVFTQRLVNFFPSPLRDRFADAITGHRLRREIVTTSLVNDVVDKGGLSHLFRLREASGGSTTEGVRAFVVATEVFGTSDTLHQVTHTPADVATGEAMFEYIRRLLFRASRWLLAYRPQPLAVAAEITRYSSRVADLTPRIEVWCGEASSADIERRRHGYVDAGVTADLAGEVALALHRFCLFDIIDAAEIADRDLDEVGELYFALMEHFGFEELLTSVSELEHGDRWHSLARLALRDDLHGALRSLTLKVLEVGEPEESAAEKIDEWESSNTSRLSRSRSMLADITESGASDLATLSVATRQLRSMVR